LTHLLTVGNGKLPRFTVEIEDVDAQISNPSFGNYVAMASETILINLVSAILEARIHSWSSDISGSNIFLN